MPDVLWLTRYGPEGASSRYRAYQFDSDLRRAGWQSQFEPLAIRSSPLFRRASSIARRWCRVAGLRPNEGTTVVQKEPLMPPVIYAPLQSFAFRGHGPVVWDIDDAVWIGRAGASRMAVSMARCSDVVVAGNDLLAEWASQFAADVKVIPTCFQPPSVVSPGRHQADGSRIVRVVWVGSPATAPFVEFAGRALRDALLALPQLEIEFIGGLPPRAIRGHRRVRTTTWSPDAEHNGLRTADFGLALQPRGAYADHKCGFKVVQYMAYGVVPIVSDSPVHRSILGGNGLLVDDHLEGIDLISRLESPPSQVERTQVIDRWSGEFSRSRGVQAWAEILSGLGSG